MRRASIAGRIEPAPVWAFFISPHGLGHAARAAAVMAAVRRRRPDAIFHLYTSAPRWFFRVSVGSGFHYHRLVCDIGLVQRSALAEDLRATARALAAALPFDGQQVARWAAHVRRTGARLVVCDIAPLGIAVARAAGIPSILVENFTWDWIYSGYPDPTGRLRQPIAYLRTLFKAATYHIQTEPVCRPRAGADLTTAPVCRPPRLPAGEVRRRLGIPAQRPVVLLTMGGVAHNLTFLSLLARRKDVCFLLPGNRRDLRVQDAVYHVPQHLDFYHPDLVHASDAVVGKAGYSSLAEVYSAGVPFGYVLRDRWRESGPLAVFIRRRMQGLALTPREFESGAWLQRLDTLLMLPRRPPRTASGASQIADFLIAADTRAQARLSERT